MQRNVVVLAFKFNDILYASSTQVFKDSSRKILIILADKIPKDNYPNLELFNDVYYYKVPITRSAQMVLAMQIVRENKSDLHKSILILSNPYILITQLIMIFGRVSEGVLIEDGVMNYYAKGGGAGLQKWIQYKILDICRFWSYFNITYLLDPERALTFLGEPRKLILNDKENLKRVVNFPSLLKNKKLLIGGGAIEFKSDFDKERIVASISLKLGIDYYIPHHSDRVGACGLNIMDISSEKLTLEMIYPFCTNLKVYSFGSSAAYNAKGINPDIEVVYLRLVDEKWLNSDFDLFMIKNNEKILEISTEGKIMDLL